MKKYFLHSILIIVFVFSFFVLSNSAIAGGSWSSVGTKIVKSTVDGATGNDILIAYSGLGVDITGAEKWAQALIDAALLKDKGVGTVYAVAGPADEYYVGEEITNTKLVADILDVNNYKSGSRIFIVAHSSGEYPAIEFLNQINANSSVIGKSITVFDIEGDTGTVSAGIDVKAADYSVVGHSIIIPTEYSVNYSKIAGVGILKDISVDTTGCIAVLPNCIHMRLVNKESTQGFNAINADYNSVNTQNVEASYLTGITPSTSTPGPKAITGTATDITINSATLKGTVNVNGDDSAFVYFQYAEDKGFNVLAPIYSTSVLISDADVAGDIDINISASIEDLEPGTIYHYRVIVIDSNNVTTPGKDKTFTTKTANIIPATACNASNCLSPKTCVNGVCTAATTTTTTSSDGAGLVPCTENCGFSDVFKLINNVIHFILFDMAIPIAAIMFAYAGFLLITSGGETSKRTKAKKIFTNVAIGLIIAVAAFLIIKTILSIVGYKSDWNWFGF